MAKKKNKLDTILKRAEKLFKTGNYLEAGKKFEKAQKQLKSPKIEEKLAVCRRETGTLKGKELVDKAQKAVNDNDLPSAITYFQQATPLLNEAWITQKVRELEACLANREMDASARAAMASGDHQAAADIFATSARQHLDAWKTDRNPADLRKAAVKLVKAGRFPKAMDLFKQLDDFDDTARYHFGYALARSQKFQEALEQWDTLNSKDNSFLDQTKQVLVCAVDQACQDLASGAGKEDILARASWLFDFARLEKDKKLTTRLGALLDYCTVMSAEISWNAADYKKVEVLQKKMTLTADLEVIHLKAVTLYHLSKTGHNTLKAFRTAG